jgi:hypothetical protein
MMRGHGDHDGGGRDHRRRSGQRAGMRQPRMPPRRPGRIQRPGESVMPERPRGRSGTVRRWRGRVPCGSTQHSVLEAPGEGRLRLAAVFRGMPTAPSPAAAAPNPTTRSRGWRSPPESRCCMSSGRTCARTAWAVTTSIRGPRSGDECPCPGVLSSLAADRSPFDTEPEKKGFVPGWRVWRCMTRSWWR